MNKIGTIAAFQKKERHVFGRSGDTVERSDDDFGAVLEPTNML